MNKKCFLGIDVSKGYADLLLLDEKKEVMEAPFQLTDSKQGRQKLKELITGWQQQGLEELFCGVESTGGYENNWYSFLKEGAKGTGVYVCRINPKGVKSIGDAALKRTITDAVSAENIAVYMISFPEKLDYGVSNIPVKRSFKEGRQHMTYIRMLQKQKVQLSNQLEKLLYQYFAEILIYCRHGNPDWLLNMLAKYPTAALVAKANVTKLSAIKGITAEKARAIMTKAGNNSQEVSPHITHVIMNTVKEILHKQGLIEDEREYLTTIHQTSEEVKLLESIPCIGTQSGVTIVLEIEDISRFATVKKLAAFFGTHPTFKQSGDGLWGNHMSKKGRGELRALLYMAALSGIRYNPILKQVYKKARSKGMKHYPAAGVVMHKLLRMIYGILKNKTKFNADTDIENQQKALGKQQENQQKEKETDNAKTQQRYRFQQATTQAPISRRAEQKIKKQMASQSSD